MCIVHQKDYFDPSKHIEPRIIEFHEHKQRVFPQMKLEGCLHLTTLLVSDMHRHTAPRPVNPEKVKFKCFVGRVNGKFASIGRKIE